MQTRDFYLQELAKRSPRIPAEIEVLRTATSDELAWLKERNPELDLSVVGQDPPSGTEE